MVATSEFVATTRAAMSLAPEASTLVLAGRTGMPGTVRQAGTGQRPLLGWRAGRRGALVPCRPVRHLVRLPGFWLSLGTTGTPKAAMHRHRACISRVCETYAHQVLGITPEDALLLGGEAVLRTTASGTRCSSRSRSAPPRSLASPRHSAGAAARLAGTARRCSSPGPHFFAALLAARTSAAYQTFASVRLATSDGRGLPAEIYRRFTGTDAGSTSSTGWAPPRRCTSSSPTSPAPRSAGTSGTVVPEYDVSWLVGRQRRAGRRRPPGAAAGAQRLDRHRVLVPDQPPPGRCSRVSGCGPGTPTSGRRTASTPAWAGPTT